MQVVSWEQAREAFRAVRQVAAIVVGSSLAAACVAPFPPELQAENHERVAKVLANAYGEVSENYIDRVEVGELAIAGLGNLSQLDPAFSVHADEQIVLLKLREDDVHRFSRPPADDVDAWADVAADALIAARAHSGPLRAITGRRTFENHFEGIADSLGGGAHYSNDESWREVVMPKYDGGILFTVRAMGSGLEVWRLDPDGRLEAAGLRKGDIISHIDATPVQSLSGFNLPRALMGPVGSQVTLTVLRGEPPVSSDLQVVRWEVEAPTYQLVRKHDIAIFRLPYLNFRATHELERRLGTELRKARYGEAGLKGIVLDLRGNLGGGAMVSVDLANSFLGKGVISTLRDYRPEPKQVVNASWPDHSENVPLVVLVDGFTGYGAEEVVAALQDNGRALVVGSTTQGDGIVRANVRLFNMGDIWMRVAFSHAPSGYGLAGRGVMPHVCTSAVGTAPDDVTAALREGEGVVAAEVRQRHIDPQDEEALKAFRELCPPTVDEGDLSLDLAVEILKEPGLYARLMQQAGSI